MLKNGGPLIQVSLAPRCKFIDPASRATLVRFPFGGDVAVHLQLPKSPVQSAPLDFGIGEGVLLQIRGQVGLGVFDHIKNRGDHGAAHYGLEFVTFWPYRRAGRRILGDYVLTQQQVQNPRPLQDAIAYGCWGIDIHPTDGILARKKPPMTPKRADEHFDRLGSQVYQIPIRALYSRNIRNLLTAGRTISTSHVGFGSTRVLSTSATVGQASGVVAAQCRKYKVVQVTFDTNPSRRLTQPLSRYPECVKDYDVKVFAAGSWKTVASIRDNYVRRRVHRFERINSDRVRLEILASNGAPSARVYEVRLYDQS